MDALRLAHEFAPRHPLAFGHLLSALDFHASPVQEVALVGEPLEPLEAVLRARLRPHLVLAGSRAPVDGTAVALLQQRTPIDGRAAAYVCERFACQAPVTEAGQLALLLGDQAPPADDSPVLQSAS